MFEDLLPSYCYATQNNPLASLATCLCRQKSGHEWIAISSLHDTRTVKLWSLVQCQCYTGKQTVIAVILKHFLVATPSETFARLATHQP